MDTKQEADRPLGDLLEIIHFTENVSAKIHGLRDEAEIYRTVKEEFGKSKRYAASILLLTDDGQKLRIAEASLIPDKVRAGEKATGLRLRGYEIDLTKSRTYSQVVREGKTIQANVDDLISESLPRPLAYLISKTMGYDKKPSILTPLKRREEIVGALAVSSTELAEHFVPSVRNLAQHISTALGLAAENSERQRVERALQKAHDQLEKQVKERTRELARTNKELRIEIAERKRVEEGIKESESRLKAAQAYTRNIIDSSLDMIIAVDMERRIVEFNRAAQKTFGYRPEQVIGKHVDMLYVDSKDSVTVHDTTVKNGQCIREILNRRKNGQTFPSLLAASVLRDANGEAVGIMGISRDITEPKQAEETLRQRNRELALLHRAGQTLGSSLKLDQVFATVLDEVRRLLNVIACSVWLKDPETGELVCQQAMGPQSEIVRGWRLAPGVGIAGWVAHSGRSLIVPDVHADERHFRGVDRETGLPVRSILSVPLQVKGKTIGVLQVVDEQVSRFGAADLRLLEPLASSAAIAIENARLHEQVQRHAAELEQRVTERTHELAEANVRLEELDRLKSKFVTDVSHELRTPIANIQLYLGLLQRGPPEKSDQYLAIINEQSHRLSNLIEDILNLSRLDLREAPVEFAPVDLNAVAEQVITAHQSRAEVAGLELIFEPSKALPPIHADLNQVTQVVTNLVDNAVNYTPTGHVRISTDLDAERGQASLEVQDTGMGIEPQDMAHVFERFYRGRRVGSLNIPGTGLGLAIVSEIVDLHGGEIEVKSQPGKGSTFRVWLPLAEGQG